MKTNFVLCVLGIATLGLCFGQSADGDTATCPPGFMEHNLTAEDSFFNYRIRFNRKNLPEMAFFLGLEDTTNFIKLKGKDSYLITSHNESEYFILKRTCVKTKYVRNVLFTAFTPERNVVVKDIKSIKGIFTESCMVIKGEGLRVNKMLYQFRATKGTVDDTVAKNEFFVRSLILTACIPVP